MKLALNYTVPAIDVEKRKRLSARRSYLSVFLLLLAAVLGSRKGVGGQRSRAAGRSLAFRRLITVARQFAHVWPVWQIADMDSTLWRQNGVLCVFYSPTCLSSLLLWLRPVQIYDDGLSGAELVEFCYFIRFPVYCYWRTFTFPVFWSRSFTFNAKVNMKMSIHHSAFPICDVYCVRYFWWFLCLVYPLEVKWDSLQVIY